MSLVQKSCIYTSFYQTWALYCNLKGYSQARTRILDLRRSSEWSTHVIEFEVGWYIAYPLYCQVVMINIITLISFHKITYVEEVSQKTKKIMKVDKINIKWKIQLTSWGQKLFIKLFVQIVQKVMLDKLGVGKF